MSLISIPRPELQIDFSFALGQIRNTYLQEALSKAVSDIDISILDTQLSKLVPAKSLSINLIIFAKSAIYGDVILKLAGPHGERLTEVTALQIFNGEHACKCLDFEKSMGALLLERIYPGKRLR